MVLVEYFRQGSYRGSRAPPQMNGVGKDDWVGRGMSSAVKSKNKWFRGRCADGWISGRRVESRRNHLSGRSGEGLRPNK